MRRATILAVLGGTLLVAVLASSSATAEAPSKACGRVDGVPIHAHKISCRTARHIYRADMAGDLPAGWNCSASLARCYRGEVGRSDEYLWWRRTTYRQLAGAVVLGGRVYGGPNGEGWGTPHPAFIYNGGDASGSIDECTGLPGAGKSLTAAAAIRSSNPAAATTAIRWSRF